MTTTTNKRRRRLKEKKIGVQAGVDHPTGHGEAGGVGYDDDDGGGESGLALLLVPSVETPVFSGEVSPRR